MDSIERKKFAEILYNTKNPDNLPACEFDKIYQPLLEFMNTFFPQTLYRYRSCEERQFEAFYKNQIWASNAECMNDGFDSRMFFDQSAVESEVESELSDEALSRLLNSFKETPPLLFRGILNCDIEILTNQLKQYRNFIKSNIPYKMAEIVSSLQRTSKFACFSEDICSPAMWGLYSVNESGFALAYDFSNWVWTKTAPWQETFNLFPVLYNDERFKVSNEYIQFLLKRGFFTNVIPQDILQQIVPCPDKSMITKIALQKSSEWSYEKEWRIIYTRNDIQFQNNKSVSFEAIPIAVYLGRRISYINERLLRDIANEKKIPVFKMYMDDKSPTYKLIPYKV